MPTRVPARRSGLVQVPPLRAGPGVHRHWHSYSPTTAGQRLSPYTQQLGSFSTDKQPLRWIASRSRHLLPLLLLSCSQTKGYMLLQNSIAKTRA